MRLVQQRQPVAQDNDLAQEVIYLKQALEHQTSEHYYHSTQYPQVLASNEVYEMDPNRSSAELDGGYKGDTLKFN